MAYKKPTYIKSEEATDLASTCYDSIEAAGAGLVIIIVVIIVLIPSEAK